MLGKTNITTLSEGAVVTEIEDYRWIQMQSGIYGNFVKAVYKNDCLVAITADGAVAHTKDGEVWEVSRPDFAYCRLNDVDWDGNRFILAGSYTGAVGNGTDELGLILSTHDFVTYEKIDIQNNEDDPLGKYDREYIAVYPVNGKYAVIARRRSTSTNELIVYTGNLKDTWEKQAQIYSVAIVERMVSVAKNSSEMLVCFMLATNNVYIDRELVYKVTGDGGCYRIHGTGKDVVYPSPIINLFECRDALLYMSLLSDDNYRFVKVSTSNEEIILSSDINYMFVDGVYFDGCEVYINNHDMLVLKKGENIADKTIEDLVEIAPELTMNCITKAFGQLYIFGNQGLILRSSIETNNENAIAVQALSAKKALAEARAYTDERYAELEARIAALENI